MTTLPLKLVKLLPDMDAKIGAKSGYRDDKYKLTLLCESQLVRVEPLAVRPGVKDDEPFCIPLCHCGKVEPKAVEQAAAPQAVKK